MAFFEQMSMRIRTRPCPSPSGSVQGYSMYETHVVLLCPWSISKCMCVRVSDAARRWYTRAGHAIRTCERGCMRVPTMSTTRTRGSLVPSPSTRRDSACITSVHPYYRHPGHPSHCSLAPHILVVESYDTTLGLYCLAPVTSNTTQRP